MVSPPSLSLLHCQAFKPDLLPLRSVRSERRLLLPLPRSLLGLGIHRSELGTVSPFVGHCSSFSGCVSINTKSNVMLVNTSEVGMDLKEGKDFLVKRKRTKCSVSIVQPQQGVEVCDMEKERSDVLLHKVSAGKDPMNRLTDSAIQSSGNEPARSILLKVCRARGWKEPSYNFEEQGPPHNKLFTCMVTVHVEGIVNTVFECFGSPKSQKKAAQEHAAQGALWCLAQYGHVK